MKITAIKVQVKRAGRYSIYVDEKYSFSLSDVALLDAKIVTGQKLSQAEIAEFKQLSIDDKLYAQATQYAYLRPRSNWEMESYLMRKKAEPEVAQEILSKLRNLRLLNDESFARSWVASRRLLKPISRRRLLQELHAKRISDDIVRLVLAEDDTDEQATLRELVIRKRKQTRYQDDTRLMQYLARQGFSYDDIKSVLADEAASAS